MLLAVGALQNTLQVLDSEQEVGLLTDGPGYQTILDDGRSLDNGHSLVPLTRNTVG